MQATRLPAARDVVHPEGALLLERRARQAVRWRWITVNPLDQAEPPRGSRADPDPPTAEPDRSKQCQLLTLHLLPRLGPPRLREAASGPGPFVVSGQPPRRGRAGQPMATQ